MPSAITHELIAKSALALLPKEERACAEAAPEYFYLGAQGPDLFFFYRPLSKEYNFGKLLHRGRLYEWFSALLEGLKTRQGETLEKCRAYALGFCTHLEGDSAFHPFVYTYMEENDLKKREHQRIENDWDVYFAATLEEKTVYGYDFPFDLKKIAREGVLYEYVSEAAARMGRTFEKRAFSQMMLLFRRYLIHFHKRHLRYLLPFASKLYPKKIPDPGVIGGEEFFRQSGEKAADADALFLVSTDAAARRMQDFLRAAEGSPLPHTFSRHLLTGEIME